MEIEGMSGFADFFKDYAEHFAVIGGAACSQWLDEAELEFRQTKDIDVVLVVGETSRAFYERLWQYLHNGGYVKWQRADGKKVAFRFVEPKKAGYPFMIELLSRPDVVQLPEGQTVVPIEPGDGLSSLSAVLLEDAYYNLILQHRDITVSGLPAVTPDGLLPLKAKAHLNLMSDRLNGKIVRDRDIKKHRNDVFHLAYLLDETKTCELAEPIAIDLRQFLDIYVQTNTAWEGILHSLVDVNFPQRAPDELLSLIRSYYRLT